MTASGALSTCPMLEVEAQRTNNILQSEAFNNASWTKSNVTITANATTSPDGTANADKIVSDAVSGEKIATQIVGNNIAQALTASAFYKKSEYKLAFLRVGGFLTSPYVIYNLDTQAVVSTDAATSTRIEDFGNGWYRISLTVASPTAASCAPNIGFAPDSGYTLSAFNIPQYTGDGTSGGFVWGCQLETNGASFSSTYIPTTTAAVTRLKDDVTLTGASALIGQTEGTIFIDVDFRSVTSGGIRQFFQLEGSVGSQFSGLGANTTSDGNNIQYAGATYTLTQGRHKIVCTYNSTTNQRKLFVDGAQRGATGTSPAFLATIDRISVLARINPFSGFDIGRQLFGGCNQFVVFKTALTDAECIELSTL
jgi:hypothetical protein